MGHDVVMARTAHHRFSTPDPIRVVWKDERKARAAGRLTAVIAEELAELDDEETR